MKVRLFEWSGGRNFFYQWGRLKRREKNLYLFIYLAWLLHVVSWMLWLIWVAPYPIALTVPLGFDLGFLSWIGDVLWPLVNLALISFNTWLVFKIYPKDLLAAWLLLGATFFIQTIVFGITLSLVMIGA
ncbi:hypothetical protein A2810_00885 [candidate division Kazan bacterium RIFCSPHIGHO2_01_FULL_49_10]|uniref:Uncharacterized protein n=1 Tax=candidate division Kazan bacterium RIFCSPLOWO2_01_FULL_48_13 TaxID=1798539 RepID=A0A1F4PNH9_UNCK3|nr:MAG: hypothetical protein A2810_00885 [candidate division Kazan bacterium RIFCSPHIGHO2_01_FULL_49_10]OGB85403.1 MAG: hypothetical protein A2994_02140 [candidate division Kazan bacterium RIFCSPLOWO2_01_FULL_48_13]